MHIKGTNCRNSIMIPINLKGLNSHMQSFCIQLSPQNCHMKNGKNNFSVFTSTHIGSISTPLASAI